ncbi:SNF2 family N-terminal domain-containing protein [Obelidium mucronatum]|nr:SNF2 family N-terminal domain-containing protein [Obelidium mucronatum]
MPEAPQPSKVVTPLLPYQKQGLYWLMSVEHPQLPDGGTKTVQFWKFDKKANHYVNICTNSATVSPPTLARGGILADDMGLGKTLQIIALISSDPTAQGIIPTPIPTSPTFSKTTLIICPLSVISNWVDQFKQHTAPDSISVYVFHGKDRNTKPAFLADFDVVITIYNMLAQADTGYKRGLHGIQWRRVVLDEGHVIRNRNSKQTRAIVALNAERHIVVSGTPIQNSVEDLYSLMWFMKFAPFSELSYHDWFNRLLTRPLRQNTSDLGKNTLKLFMSQCCLRRNKAMKFHGVAILDLPPCNTYLHAIDFKYEGEEKAYKALNAEFERRFDEFTGDGSSSYAHILEILIRLRQVCCHPSLIGDRKLLLEKTAQDAFQAAKTNPQDPAVQRLLGILRDHLEDDCAVCLDSMTKPTVTQCGHFFCFQCIQDVISIQAGSPCPMCRARLTVGDLVELPAHDAPGDTAATELKHQPSAKIDTLLELLTTAISKDPSTKSIVFSQWSKMLDIVEPFLQHHGISYVRFDGSMTRKARFAAIERFKTGNCNVFLATLKSAGVGLNLVEANLVFLLDPWWNASVENQAMDRCYRLGQKREVSVFRLVMKGTVEERVLQIQDRKRGLIGDAFGGTTTGAGGGAGGSSAGAGSRGREARMEELKMLLGRSSVP